MTLEYYSLIQDGNGTVYAGKGEAHKVEQSLPEEVRNDFLRITQMTLGTQSSADKVRLRMIHYNSLPSKRGENLERFCIIIDERAREFFKDLASKF